MLYYCMTETSKRTSGLVAFGIDKQFGRDPSTNNILNAHESGRYKKVCLVRLMNSSNANANSSEATVTYAPKEGNHSLEHGNNKLKEVRPNVHLVGSGFARKKQESSVSKLVSTLESLTSQAAIDDLLTTKFRTVGTRKLCSVLASFKSEEKLLQYFSWMRRNGKTLGSTFASNSVFRVLGARQKWKNIDSFFLEMHQNGDCRADCFTFNTIIFAAVKVGALDSAKKYFTLMVKVGVTPNVATYGMIMSIYQKYHKLEDAKVAFEQMKDHGVQCVSAYSTMIVLYTRNNNYKDAEEVIETMRSLNVAPNRENLLVQINVYGQQGKISEAEGIFQRMQDMGCPPSIVAYNTLITAYGKASLFEKAFSTFHEILDVGLEPDEVTFNSMIAVCGKAGNFQEALHYYRQMKGLGHRTSFCNFSTLIKSYGKEGDPNGNFQLLVEMKELGCKPDIDMLDAVVRAHSKAGDLVSISRVLDFIRKAGWSPGKNGCSILFEVYLNLNVPKRALYLFSVLKSLDAWPKEILCHRLMCSCKDAGMYEEAASVFLEMKQAGIAPALQSFCTMICIYGLMGRVLDAEMLFNHLRNSNKELDTAIYNVMGDVYMNAGLLQEANQVLVMLEQAKLIPDAYTFYVMLRIHQKCDSTHEGVEAYWKMVKLGIAIDEVLYNTVINCCGRGLPVGEVLKVFRNMLDAGYLPNIVTCNVMIDIYGKAGMLGEAQHVLKLAQEKGLANSTSYNTLVNAYGKHGEFAKMEETFYEMQNYGISVSLEAFNSMLDAYGKAGDFRRLEFVLEKMKRSGCSFSILTFNILFNAFGKKGLIHELEELKTMMKEAGCAPDRWTYNILIGAYGCAKMPDEAMHVFKEMQCIGLSPDRITYFNLVAALHKSGNLLEAARWSLWMSQTGYGNSAGESVANQQYSAQHTIEATSWT